jgi:DNA-binding MarR family transcriptional regulator
MTPSDVPSNYVGPGKIQDDGDLSRAFSLLKTIRAYQRDHFPFLRNRLDFELLLFIGHGQALGTPMNLTEILTTNLSSVSTMVRHLGRLEKLGVVYKRKTDDDKRNVRYFLAPAHLDMMRGLVDYLRQSEIGAPPPVLPSERETHQH